MNQSNNSLYPADYFSMVFAGISNDFKVAAEAAAFHSQFLNNEFSEGLARRYFALRQLQGIFWKFKWEFSVLRHFYKNCVINEAIEWGNKISQDFQPIIIDGFEKSFNFGENYFTTAYYDMIFTGYSTMYHKLEGMIAMLKKHTKGNALGAVLSNNEFVDYEPILKDEGISFDDLGQINKSQIFHERIHRIREISNRAKHQAGYIKDEKDRLLNYIPNIINTEKIAVNTDEFNSDFLFIEQYISSITVLVSKAYSIAALKAEFDDTENDIIPVPSNKTKHDFLIEIEEGRQKISLDFKRICEKFKNGALFERIPN